MDWAKKAKGEYNNEKIPPGNGLKLKIVKILYGSKTKDFISRKGDPQMMVVFENDAEAQATQMFTISENAIFTLAKLLSGIYPSGSIHKLAEYGIEPGHFTHKDFAEQMLLHREVIADVSYDDKGYASIEFQEWKPNLASTELPDCVKKPPRIGQARLEDNAPAYVPPAAPDDDIPF